MDNLFFKFRKSRQAEFQLQSSSELPRNYGKSPEDQQSRLLSAQTRFDKLPELITFKPLRKIESSAQEKRIFRSYDSNLKTVDVHENHKLVPIQEHGDSQSKSVPRSIFASYARSIGVRSAERNRPSYNLLLAPIRESRNHRQEGSSYQPRLPLTEAEEPPSKLKDILQLSRKISTQGLNVNQNTTSNIHWKYGSIPLVRRMLETMKDAAGRDRPESGSQTLVIGAEGQDADRVFQRIDSAAKARSLARSLPTDFEVLSLKHRIHLARMSKEFILCENADNQTLYGFAKVMYNGVRYALDPEADPIVELPQPATLSPSLFRSGTPKKLLLLEPVYLLAVGVSSPDGSSTQFVFRPHARRFIQALGHEFLLIFYSSRETRHLNAIREYLDPEQQFIRDVLDYRNCAKTREGRLQKDLGCLTYKQRKDILIIDYKMHGLKLHPENSVILTHWNKDPTDQYLIGPALDFLLSLAQVFDVRETLRQKLDYRRYLIPP